MPHTVLSLLAAARLAHAGAVRWGLPVREPKCGLYIVSMSADPGEVGAAIPECPLCLNAINQWQHDYGIGVDGKPATASDIAARIALYWLPSEPVLYIGKTDCAGGISKRVREFHTHVLGRKSPHKGGQWLKTLTMLDRLYVHWALSDQPEEDESTLIGHFCGRNPKGPFPFANQEWRQAGRRHMRNAGIGPA